MKKLTTIIAMLVLALTVCTGQESKQRNGVPPMTTEEREVYSAYEAINKAMIEKDKAAMERYFDKKTDLHTHERKETDSGRVHRRNHGRNSKLFQSGYKGLFNQCRWRYGTYESYPYTHSESLWNKRKLDYERGKHL